MVVQTMRRRLAPIGTAGGRAICVAADVTNFAETAPGGEAKLFVCRT